MTTVPLQALNQAISNARQTRGLTHHGDHGSQYVSMVYNERLTQYGLAASTGSVGDSHCNARAENVNGSYKNEIIDTRRWAEVMGVEIATFNWVNWWSEERLHESLDYKTLLEAENEYWTSHAQEEKTENRVEA
jgi:transposase InsO family protein